MIRTTYKNTIKTLIRSPIFWVILFFVLGNVILFERMPLYSQVINEKLIMDTDPRFVLSYSKFMQMIPNYLSHSVMFYAVPAFCIVSSLIVMSNDYGKGFFEIEKAGGIKPSQHLFGRLVALVEVDSIAALMSSFLAVNYYYISRHGVKGYGFWECFSFSSVRVLRTFLFCELPVIFLLTLLSLAFGAILKNVYIASAIGIGYVMFNYAVSAYFGFRMSTFFNKYLTTNKFSAYLYFTYFDTDIAKTEPIGTGIGHIPAPASEVFMWVGILFSISLALLCVSWFFTKKRKI